MFFFEHHGMDHKNMFRVHRMSNAAFPPHLHRAYEFLYVESGILSLQVEQKQYQLHEGEAAFIFSNQIHSFSSAGDFRILVMIFSPELIGDFYSAYKGFVPQDNIVYLPILPNFFVSDSVYAQKSLLYGICDTLLKNTKLVPADNQSQAAVIQQMFAYVDRHFSESCSLKTVSKTLQYDYAYLSKLFTRLTGMHFTEYLNKYRISQACYLLKSGRLSVSETAANCGYSTLRTFHRNFRAVMQCSPREYLNR